MFYMSLPKQQNKTQFAYPWHAMVNVNRTRRRGFKDALFTFPSSKRSYAQFIPVLLISLFAVQGNYLCTSGTMAINFSSILRLQLASTRRSRRGKNRTSCTSNASLSPSLCQNIYFEIVIERASTIEKFIGVRAGLQFIFFSPVLKDSTVSPMFREKTGYINRHAAIN